MNATINPPITVKMLFGYVEVIAYIEYLGNGKCRGMSYSITYDRDGKVTDATRPTPTGLEMSI